MTAPERQSGGMFSLQGHRGARALFPENTLGGIRATIAMGIGAIEIDVGVTRDGEVVVHHDPALNPDITRDGAGVWLDGPGPLLRDLTLRQLGAYDVGRIRPGTSYAARFPDQAGHDGVGIPTLAQVLTLEGAAWTIELKLLADQPDWTVPPEDMVERVLHVASAAGALEQVTIQSFDWRAPRHARRIRPSVARAWLTAPNTLADPILWMGRDIASIGDVPRAIAAEGGGAWTPDHRSLDEMLVRQAQELGLTVVPWTVNDPAEMHRLIGWGVDGIITDRPDLGLAALADRPADAARSA